jgi:radical SAM superfamily enzyme YgiQ (UPF0313 family)
MINRKLLLVSANRHASPYPVYPLGLSYISTYLKEHMPEIQIRLYDFMNGSYEEYVRVLEDVIPDYVGISIRNIDDVNIYHQESFIAHYQEIIRLTRKNTQSVIIIGGSGFSIYPGLLFDKLQSDYAIYGEGEISLYHLLQRLDKNMDPADIDGLLYRKNGKVIINQRNNHFKNPILNFDKDLIDFYWQQSGMLNIQTKRGCPYKCIYCTYPLIEGRKVRTLNPDHIVKTLSELYFNHGIDYVFFTDSIFNINNRFNLILAEKLIAAKIGIRWGGYFNFTRIDRKLLEKMKAAGLSHIEFGTESLSDVMLKNYEKPFKLKDILTISDICNQLEIDFAHFLILGGYGETPETLAQTFENSKKINRSVFFPFIGMRIYPGTRLHEIAMQEKIVERNDPLLEPVYYISKKIDLSSLKTMATATGKPWIFPDDDMSEIMNRMRKRNKKGPLWEYLIR